MSAPTSTVPVTCCGRSGGCVCAKEATCSCGKQPALACNCEKSATENKVDGARCSCNQRAAGACTCSRSSQENTKPSGSTCACGKRSKDPVGVEEDDLRQCTDVFGLLDSCSCNGTESGASGQSYPDEIDFTTKA
ncbi:hypothetical protein D6C87_10582 [Aureobasidium pullulans]|uniref:DUF7871 domain-containing protein n=1 Tax=Aureobasidium pullulans TaxID=5580 RepID=A0AB38M0C4_AURPU|nr:hypothetical protein D6C94_04776 [Aureobasidium pullulans]THZ34103.1 hypothetical protein D6C87_10582 [Aureobasidium pullulans]